MSASAGITTQYNFRKPIEERIKEFETQDIESILLTIYEKNSEGEWERKTVLIKSQQTTYEHQDRLSKEKATHYNGVGKTVLLSGEVFLESFKAFTGNSLLSPLLVAGSLACRYTNSALDDVRTSFINLNDHSYQRFGNFVQGLGSTIQKSEAESTKSLDNQARIMESARSLARTILSS